MAIPHQAALHGPLGVVMQGKAGLTQKPIQSRQKKTEAWNLMIAQQLMR
jgi:hypothetical protein